jgi:hypothetical protein
MKRYRGPAVTKTVQIQAQLSDTDWIREQYWIHGKGCHE